MVLRPADALVTHPWFVRISGALTVAGILTGFADRVFDFRTIPLVATLLGAFMLGLSAIAFGQRRLAAQRTAPARALDQPSTPQLEERSSTDPRRVRRLALAADTERLSAELIALYERWSGPIHAEEENAIGRMLEEYHAKHRARSLGLFDRLVQEGVILNADRDRSFFERPAHPGIVEGLPDLLDEAAARLRLSDPDLAAWLGERIVDMRSLAADMREQAERPVPDLQRLRVIDDEYQQLNRDVAQRLRRDAKVWLDYYTRNPEWWSDYVRITGEQLLEVVRLYEYAADQLAFLKDQVG